ncbi:MAG: hypothetical protein AAGA48_01760 [Myxococcota bacterium]
MLGVVTALWGLTAWGQEPADAEIIVYGDALSPWQDTRWLVASETIDLDSPMLLLLEGEQVWAPAWQAEAVLRCTVEKKRGVGGVVRCTIEDAAVRVVTYNQWQRPRDRRMVNTMLTRARAKMLSSALRLRVRDSGTVTIAKEQPERSGLTALLLGPAISAFHLELPSDGWQDGRHWNTFEEPLLTLHVAEGTFGFETGSHYANLFEGRYLIQTLAGTMRKVVTGLRTQDGRDVPGATSARKNGIWEGYDEVQARFLPEEGAGSPTIEVTMQGELELHAVADFDPKLRGVRERVWTVQGSGATSILRSGRLRRLKENEGVRLGPTTQVSPPNRPRQGFVPWVTLQDSAP